MLTAKLDQLTHADLRKDSRQASLDDFAPTGLVWIVFTLPRAAPAATYIMPRWGRAT
jgi:hypothetical protein